MNELFRIGILDDYPVFALALSSVVDRQRDMRTVGVGRFSEEGVVTVFSRHPDLVLIRIDGSAAAAFQKIGKLVREHPTCKVVAIVPSMRHPLVERIRASGVLGILSQEDLQDNVLLVIRAVLSGYTCLPAPGEDQLKQLTSQEYSVFMGLAKGLGNKELARLLDLSPKTVSTHKANVYRKLGLKNSVELVQFAASIGNESHD